MPSLARKGSSARVSSPLNSRPASRLQAGRTLSSRKDGARR
jgi:hypothetical protein